MKINKFINSFSVAFSWSQANDVQRASKGLLFAKYFAFFICDGLSIFFGFVTQR